MFLLGTILGLFIGMFLMSCLSINTINEKDSLIYARTKDLKNAEKRAEDLNNENKELKTLRKQTVHSNTILVDKNKELTQLLTEIADRVFCCPLDSEKIVLDKIKSLVRDYQSEN